MKFELDLLGNSYDYIYNSFDLYDIAREGGIHDERSNLKNKVKWKLAFVTMVQAVELLLKEGLYRIHPSLIYENIDLDKIPEKTVSFQQAINRINNLNNNLIDMDRKKFLLSCSKIRNNYIHYKVSVESEKIKSKYCKLYFLYKELHKKFFERDVEIYDEIYSRIENEIIGYYEHGTIFRGLERHKIVAEDLEQEFGENVNRKYYITKDNRKVERILFGDENKYIKQQYTDEYGICGECEARKGEYHLVGCDMELCPVCHEQVISCGCIKVDGEDELITGTD
ncbi:hypothetical protein [Clostridium beijerinckii]|uniref:Uncharacterized protein n=1 Tax=Clostridium beijerinckii TaxID=1520 RepID=A0A1S9N995_CLOBE|nr:hypothetical protein [Clostridium beijerinckii]OOP74116.1 hypothetical protein CBEIBR21_06355 [Clostridium beijerinckii]